MISVLCSFKRHLVHVRAVSVTCIHFPSSLTSSTLSTLVYSDFFHLSVILEKHSFAGCLQSYEVGRCLELAGAPEHEKGQVVWLLSCKCPQGHLVTMIAVLSLENPSGLDSSSDPETARVLRDQEDPRHSNTH